MPERYFMPKLRLSGEVDFLAALFNMHPMKMGALWS